MRGLHTDTQFENFVRIVDKETARRLRQVHRDFISPVLKGLTKSRNMTGFKHPFRRR